MTKTPVVLAALLTSALMLTACASDDWGWRHHHDHNGDHHDHDGDHHDDHVQLQLQQGGPDAGAGRSA